MVARLRAAGCVFAEDEARLLGDRDDLVARRCAGERLEHVLGWADFGGVHVVVETGVFIPRPQTVALAQAAAALRPRVALDLFSGSGAIAAYVAAHCPGARVVAAEVHVTDCLRANVREVYESDVDGGLPVDLEGRVDVLTANVPYVPTGDLDVVPHEGEPRSALDGGKDGLDWTRRLLACAPRWLRPEGVVLTEVARHQVDATRAIAEHHGFRVAQLTPRVGGATQNGVVVSASRRPEPVLGTGAVRKRTAGVPRSLSPGA